MGCGSSSSNTAVVATSNSNLKVNDQITTKTQSENIKDQERNQIDRCSVDKENFSTDQSSKLKNQDIIHTNQTSDMFSVNCPNQGENEKEVINENENQDKNKKTDTTEDEKEAEKTMEEDVDSAGNKEKVKKVPLTEEEIQEKIQKTFADAKHTWGPLQDKNLLIDAETGKCNATFRRIANNTFLYHFRLKGCPLHVQTEFKSDYYRLMVAEDAVTKFCDMLVYILKQGYEEEDGEMDAVMYKPLVNTFGVLTNFTDNQIQRADIVANHPEFLNVIAENLKAWTEPHVCGEKISVARSKVVISSPLSILHNIAMQDQNISRLQSLGFVDLLKPFVNSPQEKNRLSAVATLADIVDEQQSEIIRADEDIMKFIKSCLIRAMKDKSRRTIGWSPQELARTVRRIARNDANKRALVEKGIIPPLVKLAESEDVLEQREAVGAMWTLSFDEENQKDMIQDNECKPVDTFIRLQHSPDKEVRKTCNGALWTMRDRLAQSENYKDVGQKYMSPQGSPAHVALSGKEEFKSEGHIMISYQWGNQNMLKRIRDGLRANGFKVWMDIDDMEGSTLDAMARAVENADVVLVCFSQKYKDSDNCRAEAEYAFQKKKKIIPLKMEQNYKPDGWLGFICGAKLFFDFGGKYSFESRMEGLVKELFSKQNKDVTDGVIIPETVSVVAGAPVAKDQTVAPVYSRPPPAGVSHVSMASVDSVKKWNDKDVDKWMAKHSLSVQHVKKMTGLEIAFLMLLKMESPDFFYKVITDTLKITNLLTIAQIRFALDDTTL
ncbi:uncharacterized protein LOC132544855 [Ylistrum balloti]|uniref:uncharacterized protein LOC132544855 n=1 Tax=Ylistrum balloti TaxID=509963 RepID=UPI002905F043|nr:uncharacterized protein LOC132544855 [Ylistrum balloti]